MGIEYYAFALFIAALVCVVAILFKLLFANVKRQHKLLDEKETKLLQLYRNVESIMDEFNDQIRASIDDIKEYEERAVAHMASSLIQPREASAPVETERYVQPPMPPPRPMTVDASRIRAASEVLERAERMVKSGGKKPPAPAANRSGGEVIQRLFDDGAVEPRAAETETQAKNTRKESILALAQDGKTHAQIAQELGITQNEVKLVIGLSR